MRSIADFLVHFRRQRRWTRALVAAVPEAHFDWRPAPDAFSCGDLVRHLMLAEIFWVRLIAKAAVGERLDPWQLTGSAEERLRAFRPRNLRSADNRDYGGSFAEALARWQEISRRSEEILGAIPDEALHAREVEHPLTTLRAPLWEFCLGMVEHEAHHRGQLSAYLKMLGVEQPAAAIGAP